MKPQTLFQLTAGGLLLDGTRRLVGRHAPLRRRSLGTAEAGLGVAILTQVPFSVPAMYRAFVHFYDPTSYLWRNWLGREIHQSFDRALSTYCSPGVRVLDLGCGTAANLERLIALDLPFESYSGVDLSEAMVNRARAKFAHLPNVHFQQLDLLADPLPVGPFDLVISTWVFSHLPDPVFVVKRALERVRPGGHAVFLYLAENNAVSAPFWRLILRIFSTRPVADDVAGRFPGVVAVERFAGGSEALAILAKPEPSQETTSGS